MTRRQQLLCRAGLLAALLAAFAGFKADFHVEYGWGTDGRYYTQLARHVRDGDGLVSSVSLYHQGFVSWPRRVNQAPLWPLLLGTAARVAPLEVATRRLPELLYFIDLLLIYALGNRLWSFVAKRPARGLLSSGAPDFGHVAVALLGLNPVFFRFTSAPYTEGLAFALCLAALLALERAALRGRLGWAAAAGGLAMLGVLTRGHLLPLAVAVVAGLALAAWRTPTSWRLPAAGLAGALVVLAPWVAYLATWLPELSLPLVLGFATLGEDTGMPGLQFWVATDTWGEYLKDRGGGVAVAFDPRHRWSYFRTQGPVVALVPLALLLVLVGALRARAWPRHWLGPDSVLVWALLAVGVGMLLPVHHAHVAPVWGAAWLFAHRHGLPMLFLVLPAAALLLSRRWPGVRWLAAVVVAASLVHGVSGIWGRVRLSPLDESDIEVARWLDAQPERPVVLSTRATLLALRSRAYFHWTQCSEPGATTRRLLEAAGVDYVVLRPDEWRCRFLDGTETLLAPVAELAGGEVIVLGVGRPKPSP